MPHNLTLSAIVRQLRRSIHEDTDQPSPAAKVGKMVADGILEVMRGRERGFPAALLEKLGTIGERLAAVASKTK